MREFQRLYVCAPDAAASGEAPAPVRSLVLDLAQPAQWRPLAAVWRGVQADLDLPAPGIAVNGVDGLQLWFSWAQPLQPTQALAFGEQLHQRYMADVASHRVRWAAPASPALQATAAAAWPDGPWPAFVAADLAPLFEDTPWLDVRPGDEGQADLLARLGSIKPAVWAAALQRLHAQVPQPAPPQKPQGMQAGAAHPQALRFLRSVMDDASAPLALRVEAAKALLPYGNGTDGTGTSDL